MIPASPIGLLAICYIVTSFLWRLPEPIWFICFLKIAFLLPIQSYVNRINALASPGHDPNSRFDVWNWIAVFGGGLLFILVVIGSFLPKQQTDPQPGNRAARSMGHNNIITQTDSIRRATLLADYGNSHVITLATFSTMGRSRNL
jgi:hypothetical protein